MLNFNLSIRSCLNCGSWFRVRTFFCDSCHSLCLQKFSNPVEIHVEGIRIKSLLKWPPGESDVLSALVLQMKDEGELSWNIWAQEFLHLWSDSIGKNSRIISSQSASGKMHSQNWASALAGSLGFETTCALKPVAMHAKQRELSRSERAQRAFDLSVEFSNSSHKRVIFADDVVTTGQTALAAYKALKEPSDFEVWCLIYREL